MDSVPFLGQGAVVAAVDLVAFVDVARVQALDRIAVLVHLVVLLMTTSRREQSCSSPFCRVACLRLRRLIVVGRRGGLGNWMPLSENLKVEVGVEIDEEAELRVV